MSARLFRTEPRNSPSNLKPIAGLRFGKLTVIDRVRTEKNTFWRCLCDCGETRLVASHNLKNGNYKSCGCEKPARAATLNFIHGLSKTKTWNAWQTMIRRCVSPTARAYKDYGGRGITVCHRWRRFENFLVDMGVRPEGMTIERIDVNGDYEPSNCEWISLHHQNENTRRTVRITVDGATRSLTTVCRERSINRQWAYYRIVKLGLDAEKVLSADRRLNRHRHEGSEL